jgi:antitoxin component YwqK of YwqJK toxin-antitoxin module
VYDSDIVEEDGISYYMNKPFTGTSYSYYYKFDKKTSIRTESEYKKGLLDGKYIIYHEYPPNEIKMSIEYKNGIENGVVQGYNSKGEKDLTGLYIDGEKKGLWVYVDEYGNAETINYGYPPLDSLRKPSP